VNIIFDGALSFSCTLLS